MRRGARSGAPAFRGDQARAQQYRATVLEQFHHPRKFTRLPMPGQSTIAGECKLPGADEMNRHWFIARARGQRPVAEWL
jgi:hypothetical protein